MADILIVEDDPGFGELLLMHLEDQGHTVRLAGSIAEGREQFQLAVPDAVLLDQQLPDGLGTQLLEAFTGMADHPPVIIITGVSDTRLVIEAMQRGAYDFIRKPLEPLELDTRLGNALRQHRLSRQVAASASQTLEAGPDAIVGTSPAIIEILKTVGRVADSGACCLITGDSGTGKEVIARALHRHSGRTGPFLAINCSAIVDTLLESELFGHEKGAFTGAMHARRANSRSHPTVRCSWMKSGNCNRRCRPNCYVCCRRAVSSEWAVIRSYVPARASSPPPIAICKPWSGKAASVRICTTGST